jgi:PPM family protein phosphatase
MEIAHRTHIGLVRDLNEDSIHLFRTKCRRVVAIVADGMGGHQAGDVASQQTIKIMERYLAPIQFQHTTEDKSNHLLQAVGKANEQVFSLAMRNNQYQGMGTTVVGAVIDLKEVVLAHVGDSRAYMLHDGGLYQLTEDHSYVNMLQKHGQITAEEAKNHPQRNMIVRAVGTSDEVEVDLITTPWEQDDILLLCSDGLTTMVSEREIGEVLSQTGETMEEKADRLLQMALNAGGKDNVSLILLKHRGASSPS